MANPYDQFDAVEANPYDQFDPPKAKPKAKVGVVQDVLKGGASGVAQGVNAQIHAAPDALDTGLRFGAALGNKLLGREYITPETVNSLSTSIRNIPSTIVTNPFRGKTSAQSNADLGIDYQAQTLPGKVAQKVGQFAPNALAGPAGGAKSVAGQVIGRSFNVLAPAAGAVAGREGVKALGGGEGAQAIGEVVGGVTAGVGVGLRVPKGTPKPKAPTLDELRTQKNAAYAQVDQSGVTYTPESMGQLGDDVRAKFGDAYDPDLHHGVRAALKKVDGLKSGPVTLTKLDQARQFVRDNVMTPTASKGERRLGHQMISAIDEFVERAGPESLSADPAGAAGVFQGGGAVGQDASQAAADIKNARNLNTRVAKIEAVEGAAARARNRASQTGSGGNIDNATRQELRKVLERGRNWTADEAAALDQAATGTKAQNAVRAVGKMAPTGNGLQQTMHVGAAMQSGGATAPISGITIAAKFIADRVTRQRVSKIVDLIARGGKDSLQAEAQLANMARQNPQIRNAYQEVARRLLTLGTVATTAAVPQAALAETEAP